MLVDKIDFVEFDRQWRGLFDDGCDYELVVNDKSVAANRCAGLVDLGYVYNRLGRYSKSAAGVALQHMHWLEDEVTLSFRKKPEPLPEGWRKVEGSAEWRRNVQTVRINSTSLWMYATEHSIHSYLGSVQLVRGAVEGLTPAQAAKQCEEATAVELHELIREITHGR